MRLDGLVVVNFFLVTNSFRMTGCAKFIATVCWGLALIFKTTLEFKRRRNILISAFISAWIISVSVVMTLDNWHMAIIFGCSYTESNSFTCRHLCKYLNLLCCLLLFDWTVLGINLILWVSYLNYLWKRVKPTFLIEPLCKEWIFKLTLASILSVFYWFWIQIVNAWTFAPLWY